MITKALEIDDLFFNLGQELPSEIYLFLGAQMIRRGACLISVNGFYSDVHVANSLFEANRAFDLFKEGLSVGLSTSSVVIDRIGVWVGRAVWAGAVIAGSTVRFSRCRCLFGS